MPEYEAEQERQHGANSTESLPDWIEVHVVNLTLS